MENTAISRIKIGQTWFYYHDSCLDTAKQLNVNDLPLDRLEEDRKAFDPVDLSIVPDEMICSYCHKSIR